MKNRGWTVIEVLIAAVMIAIVALVILGAATGKPGSSSISFGFNGVTETRCIDGLKFVVGEGGNARQVLDEEGRGVRCGKQ